MSEVVYLVRDEIEDKVIAVGVTAEVVSSIIGISKQSVSNYASKHYRYARRYKIKAIDSDKIQKKNINLPDKLIKEWDEVRTKLNPNIGRV